LWVDTGSEQLVIPLASVDAVRRSAPRSDLLLAHGSNGARAMAYVWARDPARGAAGAAGEPVIARFFFPKFGSVIEDPGTGSACANLGGWFLATGAPRPLSLTVSQGEAVGRPSRLDLAVDAEGQVFVSGEVIELGRGVFRI
jgi:PhzF family phenazine biosynthesis protein